MNVLNTIELYTLKWLRLLTLCYEYFTSIAKVEKGMKAPEGNVSAHY